MSKDIPSGSTICSRCQALRAKTEPSRLQHDSSSSFESPRRKTLISVVIPTVQERQSYLSLLLKSIASSRMPTNANVELVLVCDNAFSIGDQLLTLGPDAFSLNLIRNIGKIGAARARNVGIRASKGQVICFLDDDVIMHPEYLDSLLRHYEQPIDGVAGRVWLAPELARKQTPETLWLLAEANGFPDGGVSGANMSFRRDILLKLGGFDELLGTYSYSEDLDILMRARNTGYRVILSGSCAVIHFKASSGGIEGKDLSLRDYLYYSVRNDTYVHMKNQPWPLNHVKAVRKSIRRVRNLRKSRNYSSLDILVAASLSLPKAYHGAFKMYTEHKRHHSYYGMPHSK